MKTVTLRPGKERSLVKRHPWVFESSIARGGGDAGETVRVESHDGRFLAWGAYSPSSKIRVRAWTFDEQERVDHAFFKRRVAQAVAYRQRLAVRSDGVRLIHGEADGLPGLIVDHYGDTLSAQFLSAGMERWRAETPRDKHGTSTIDPADYGLDKEALRARFGFYRERCGI